MHILLLPSWHPPQRGDFFRIQAEKILKQDNKVNVIYLEEYSIKNISALRNINKFIGVNPKQEGPLHVFRTACIRIPIFERINLHLRVFFYFLLMKKYIKAEGIPNIIHTHSSLWGGYFCCRLKKRFDIPYVITERRGRFSAKNKLPNPDIRPWFKSYLAKTATNAGKIICVSKNQFPFFESLDPNLDKTKLIEIPNLFETDFGDIPLQKKSIERHITFLNIAIFSPYKNHALLIAATEKLVKEGFGNFEINLAGNGSLFKKYQKIVHKKGLSKYIRFLGYCNRTQLIEQFRKTDYMVLSSLAEGQPVSILESFAMGTPVIVPDLVTDYIVNDSNGLVYKTGDLQDFISKIKQALKEPLDYDMDILRKHALENFSEKAIVPKIIQVYNDVLKK